MRAPRSRCAWLSAVDFIPRNYTRAQGISFSHSTLIFVAFVTGDFDAKNKGKRKANRRKEDCFEKTMKVTVL
jgi:hypothetical protein